MYDTGSVMSCTTDSICVPQLDSLGSHREDCGDVIRKEACNHCFHLLVFDHPKHSAPGRPFKTLQVPSRLRVWHCPVWDVDLRIRLDVLHHTTCVLWRAWRAGCLGIVLVRVGHFPNIAQYVRSNKLGRFLYKQVKTASYEMVGEPNCKFTVD